MFPLEDPGAVIASLPRWIGAIPQQALLLVWMRRAGGWPRVWMSVEGVSRFDVLGSRDLAALAEIAEVVREICVTRTPDAACVLVVDAEVPDSPIGAYRDLVSVLDEQLAHNNVLLADAWLIPTFDPGRRWSSLRGDRHGVLPAVTPEYRPHPSGPLAEQLAHHLTRLSVTDNAPADAGEARDWLRGRVVFVLRRVYELHAAFEVTAADLAEVAIALRHTAVRDCCYGLAVSSYAEPALAMWRLLWQTLPHGHRAEAALLLAVSAYLAADVALATAAIQTARIDNSDPLATRQIADAIDHRLPAHVLRVVAQAGVRQAATLGIDLV
ncbi:DUF4192 family protein [Nocardia terpenica]|uniref:DUF4192 family protein n=1 Tax=Nocardia terpenica TaxID=455432 RepID=A0A161X9P3_9NOCA|nr:DUF4192 family protein [Nocardia terpenica]KZM69818.1 hypothetical protein AWN90_04170 [Nocardia terpenica]NQE91166.1 DUF4192 family protein [Nocardia terpenica]